MLSPMDTSIAFFGGACSVAALEACVRLADAGFDVVAGEHHPREAVVLNAAGISIFPSRADVVQGCQVIITSCARPSDVEELYLGDNGLLELCDPGTYFIDMSFVTPRLAREINAMAAISELSYVDAPVVNAGDNEQAVAFVAGDGSAIEDISPLLPYLATSIYPQEKPGDGMLAAAMTHIGLAGSLMSTIEAMSVARLGGLSQQAAMSVLASTSAGTRALVDYVPKINDYDFSGRISVNEMLDNLDTALLTAEELGVTLPLTETAYQLYDLLAVVGGENMTIQALSLLYEDEQTCAKYGLDWALAEGMQQQQQPPQPGGMDDLGGLNGINGISFGGGGHDSCGHDGCGHDHGDGPDGPDRGYPSAGSFFSFN